MEDEDANFQEFLKLQKEYAEATMEERERLRPDLERAVEKVLPGFLEAYDTRSANGDYLKDMVDQCMQRVLARPDLAPRQKNQRGGGRGRLHDVFPRGEAVAGSQIGDTRLRDGVARTLHWDAGGPQPRRSRGASHEMAN
jgi:hypothetical protein